MRNTNEFCSAFSLHSYYRLHFCSSSFHQRSVPQDRARRIKNGGSCNAKQPLIRYNIDCVQGGLSRQEYTAIIFFWPKGFSFHRINGSVFVWRTIITWLSYNFETKHQFTQPSLLINYLLTEIRNDERERMEKGMEKGGWHMVEKQLHMRWKRWSKSQQEVVILRHVPCAFLWIYRSTINIAEWRLYFFLTSM